MKIVSFEVKKICNEVCAEKGCGSSRVGELRFWRRDLPLSKDPAEPLKIEGILVLILGAIVLRLI